MINASKTDKKIFKLTISPDDAVKYESSIGIENCLLFDNEPVNGAKSKADTAYLALIIYLLSQYYNEVYPGEDTVLLDCSYKLLKPFHLDRNYNIEIAFPVINFEENSYLLLAKILDSGGNICLFVYLRLARK